jgi:hypothetical protein
MIHQYEEHAHGGFVEFFNATVGEGYGVLTKTSAFWINSGFREFRRRELADARQGMHVT